jgi:hypothetical protein
MRLQGGCNAHDGLAVPHLPRQRVTDSPERLESYNLGSNTCDNLCTTNASCELPGGVP